VKPLFARKMLVGRAPPNTSQVNKSLYTVLISMTVTTAKLFSFSSSFFFFTILLSTSLATMNVLSEGRDDINPRMR